MHDTATGPNIFNAIKQIMDAYNLPLKNLVSLATIGTPLLYLVLPKDLKHSCKKDAENKEILLSSIDIAFSVRKFYAPKFLNIGHVLKKSLKL